MKDIKLSKLQGKKFSLTDQKKQPCLAAKACHLKNYKLVLYQRIFTKLKMVLSFKLCIVMVVCQ